MSASVIVSVIVGLLVGCFASGIATYAGSRRTHWGRVLPILAVYIAGVIIGALP